MSMINTVAVSMGCIFLLNLPISHYPIANEGRKIDQLVMMLFGLQICFNSRIFALTSVCKAEESALGKIGKGSRSEMTVHPAR